MAALLSSHFRPCTLSLIPSLSSGRRFSGGRAARPTGDAACFSRLGCRAASSGSPRSDAEEWVRGSACRLKEGAVSLALAIGLLTGVPTLDVPAYASPMGPAVPDLAVLISGPPIKDPGALLRYGLPIDNKAIREVQKPLEDITESLKIAGLKALDSVERNVRQASRALSQGRTAILSSVSEAKKANAQELLDKLAVGMNELQGIVEERNRDAVARDGPREEPVGSRDPTGFSKPY